MSSSIESDSEVLRGRRLLAVAPVFFVSDVVRAAAWYRDVLGFSFDRIFGQPPAFCMPHRDGLTLMLDQRCDRSLIHPNGADGESWDAYVWVDDADRLFEEFRARGAKVVYPPMDKHEYGNREFAVTDLDGYILAFGSDLTRRVG